MAAGDTQITSLANLVEDPELGSLRPGRPWHGSGGLHAAVPDNATGEWKDGDSCS